MDMSEEDASALASTPEVYDCDCSKTSVTQRLCSKCQEIDFNLILRRDSNSRLPLNFNLEHILGSACPLCSFLRDCLPNKADLSNKNILCEILPERYGSANSIWDEEAN